MSHAAAVTAVVTADPLAALREALDTGLSLEKCQACACMAGAMADLELVLGQRPSPLLADASKIWRQQIVPAQYECLGCDPCFAALASNALSGLAPLNGTTVSPQTSTPAPRSDSWPPILGDYYVVGRGSDRPVALSTLGSPDLALGISTARAERLCIVGKTETENVGVEKLVLNLLATPEVRVLLLAGTDTAGHRPGETLLALARSGVDGNMRVIGSRAPRPVLKNLSPSDVDRFRKQVRVVDMVGCDDQDSLLRRVEGLAREVVSEPAICKCGAGGCAPATRLGEVLEVPDTIPEPILDGAGYFVILLDRGRGAIWVEHYDYENRLLHTLRGTTAKGLCQALLQAGWVSRMDHAAYMGRELARAESALRSGEPFFQDGA